MNKITINNTLLPYPKSFQMQKVPNVVCELTAMNGQRYADVNGWRYADTTIDWETLYPEDLERLVSAVSSDPSFSVTFADIDGTQKTVNAILKGFTGARTLASYGGHFVWENVGISLTFPDCYQY